MTATTVAAAQSDVRRVYVGGLFGQLVSAVVWFVASAVATWGSMGAGMAALWFGGMLIFPLTTLVLRVTGRPPSLERGHPFAALASQIAFTVPLGLLVALALGAARPGLFFPAAMVVVGAHYLPFVFLYGMWLFAALAGVLVSGGAALAFWAGAPATAGGWFTGLVLVVFAVALGRAARE